MLLGIGARRLLTAARVGAAKLWRAVKPMPGRVWRALSLALKGIAAFVISFVLRVCRQLPKQLKDKKKTERSETLDPMAALIPIASETEKSHIAGNSRAGHVLKDLLTSTARFSRHVRMMWVRRAMIGCLVLLTVCFLLLPMLSSAKVKHIDVMGNEYYSEQDVLSLVGVSQGDGLYSFSCDRIEDVLMEQLSYLSAVKAERRAGGLVIEVQEYRPTWALALVDGRFALLDDTWYVPQICAADAVPEGVCLLYASLPPITVENDAGETVELEQKAKVGETLFMDVKTVSLVSELSAAIASVELIAPPVRLDVTNRYAVSLTLADGTVIGLHECTDAGRRLALAAGAIRTYMSANGAQPPSALTVDVDDHFRVSIRQGAKKDQ